MEYGGSCSAPPAAAVDGFETFPKRPRLNCQPALRCSHRQVGSTLVSQKPRAVQDGECMLCELLSSGLGASVLRLVRR